MAEEKMHNDFDARSAVSPQRFLSFFEQAALPMVLLASDGHCLAANEAWERLFETPRQSLLGYNVFHDPQLEKKGVTPFIRRAFAGETAETPPVYMDPAEIGHSGRAYWLQIGYSPVRNEAGRISEVAVVVRDVTAQVQVQQQLAASVLRMRFLAEAMPQMAWLIGADGKGEYVNKRWLDYTGETDPVNAQASWAKLVHPEDRAATEERWQKAFAEGREYEMEYRLRSKQGDYRWFLNRTVPIREEGRADGPVLAWVGTATDIHERREAADTARFWADVSSALYASLDYEERLSRVAALTMLKFGGWCLIHGQDETGEMRPLAIAHSDSEQVQRAWERAHHVRPVEDSAIGIGWVQKNNSPQFIPEITDEHLMIGARDEEHLRLLRQANIRSYMCIPLRGKRGVIGTLALLSSSRQFTKEDFALAEELAGRSGIALENARLFEESKRAVEARDNLLSVTSHELRTPVTSLKLQLQMALRQLKMGKAPAVEALNRTFELSIKQVDRLSALIEDLLSFSSVSAGKLRYQFGSHDVAALVAEAIERHREAFRLAGTPITLRAPASLLAEVDLLRFGQVVENLVTNALKYGAGGAVDITLQETEGEFELVVADHGIGIPGDKLAKIFERYERVEPSLGISGFGLGLYVSREFVKAHGGSITVESEPGKGSTFRVKLPLRQNLPSA